VPFSNAIQTVFWQQLVPDLGVSYSQLNTSLALSYAGNAVGGVVFIPFAVKYGRRPVYLVSTGLMAAFTFWTARIQSVEELYATNFLSGLGGSTNETIVIMTVRSVDDVDPDERGTDKFSDCRSLLRTPKESDDGIVQSCLWSWGGSCFAQG
jgi:MFS family permease